MQLTTNTRLQNGKYRIIRVLGQGGFGITYLAENTFFDKKVAIKEFFPKDFCGRDDTSHLTLGTQNNAETVAKLKDRFLKEAKNIAKLDHPGIVKIHDIFEENNTAYYVMDYIEGENLNEMVKREGPLSEVMAVGYIRMVGDAITYIHSLHMTHFDVKPGNIVVRRRDNQPILIDFGLSKQYDIHGDATSTLMQGVSHGYSPIELYNAGALTSFSPQTDVYSLAATLYFLLTGKAPLPAPEVAENGLCFPSSVSEEIKSTIVQATQFSRAKRLGSISVFLSQLPLIACDAEDSHPSDKQSIEPEENSDTSEQTQYIEDASLDSPIHDYELEARQIKNKMDPFRGWGPALIMSFVAIIYILVFYYILPLIIMGVPGDFSPFMLTFIIIVTAILCVVWLFTKLSKPVHNKRIKAWKQEHPDDPRAKYL